MLQQTSVMSNICSNTISAMVSQVLGELMIVKIVMCIQELCIQEMLVILLICYTHSVSATGGLLLLC